MMILVHDGFSVVRLVRFLLDGDSPTTSIVSRSFINEFLILGGDLSYWLLRPLLLFCPLSVHYICVKNGLLGDGLSFLAGVPFWFVLGYCNALQHPLLFDIPDACWAARSCSRSLRKALVIDSAASSWVMLVGLHFVATFLELKRHRLSPPRDKFSRRLYYESNFCSGGVGVRPWCIDFAVIPFGEDDVAKSRATTMTVAVVSCWTKWMLLLFVDYQRHRIVKSIIIVRQAIIKHHRY